MSKREKVVLAYSGGLDTSCILVWLQEKNYDVIAFMANIGQKEDFEAAKEKAQKLGAIQVIISDVRETFVTDYMFPLLRSSAIYEDRYMLGTAIARPCIAAEMVKVAKLLGASAISHGATGKGNDQVRFELAVYALCPDLTIIAPWRMPEFYERFPGRGHLFTYAREKGVPLPDTLTPRDPWSVDANLMHTSYESGILEDPNEPAPARLYAMTADPFKLPPEDAGEVNGAVRGGSAKKKRPIRYVQGTPLPIGSPVDIEIDFISGTPVRLSRLTFEHQDHVTARSGDGGEPSTATYRVLAGLVEPGNPLGLVECLNELAGGQGIGRIDIVENRFVGMKSRGIYETPGFTVLFEAHRDLEALVLDREVKKIKKYLSDRFAEQVYNGFWFSPECEYTRLCLEATQGVVSGTVRLKLYRGHVYVISRQASDPKLSLYDQNLVSMDVQGNYQPTDADGFIKINALRLKEHQRRKERIKDLQIK